MELVKGGRAAPLWVTTDSIPTNDNNVEYVLPNRFATLT